VAPQVEASSADTTTGLKPSRARPLLELSIGYALILATIWTPRPFQRWLYLAAALWIFVTTLLSFPGWAAMGFRWRGFVASIWVVFAAFILAIAATLVAIHLNTLRHPLGPRGWLLTFGGYTVWSFAQQFMLQGYFLLRLLRILPRREGAALAAAGIFAAAHLPNPILTPITLAWGACACFVFLRCRNVYPLALAHAILGITVAVTIPGPVVHNMRVGLGYLRYHARAASADRPGHNRVQ
jgi:membrane protease YdiL (CAAX protease family)